MRLLKVEVENPLSNQYEFTFTGSGAEANILLANKGHAFMVNLYPNLWGSEPNKPTTPKVIFNPPATILIMPDGKKYVSKVHEEDFDPEKGLLMCLAKAHGITHLQLKKMIVNGKHPDNVNRTYLEQRYGKVKKNRTTETL